MFKKLWNAVDKRYLKIACYVIFTLVVSFALILMLFRIGSVSDAFGRALQWISAILKPMLIGAVFAYLFYPITRRIRERLSGIKLLQKSKKGTHTIAAAITIASLVIVLGLILTLIVFAVTKQVLLISTFNYEEILDAALRELQSFEADLRRLVLKFGMTAEQFAQAETMLFGLLTPNSSNAMDNVVGFMSGIKDSASTALFSVLFFVYFLLDAPKLRVYWGRAVRCMWTQKANNRLTAVYRDVDSVFSGYIRGQFTDALVMASMVSVAFSIIGIKYGVLIGVIAGLGNLVPYLGPVLGYGLTLLSGAISGDLKKMVIGLVVIAVIQAIDGAVINPKLLSSSIEVHPMLVILALIIGSKIGGLGGMLLSVPCAALVKVWFERYIDFMESRKTAAALPEPPAEDETT